VKRALAWALSLSLVCVVQASAAVVEGVSFPPEYSAEGKSLALNGAGLLRWKWVIKAYVAALYLGAGAQAEQVFEDVPKRLEIEYFHGIEAADFGKATLDRIRLNVSAEEFERLRPRIDVLNAFYLDVKPGDRYALTYLPGRGTELALNGRPLGSVPGADLARALFAIWLGKVPIDDSLKRALLDEP
jgi:hypothetical protein